jgi:hypothetical protein
MQYSMHKEAYTIWYEFLHKKLCLNTHFSLNRSQFSMIMQLGVWGTSVAPYVNTCTA